MLSTRVNDISEEGLLSGSGSPGQIWRVPKCPFLIVSSPEVLAQIRVEVERGRTSPGGGRETGGVLFGVQEPGRICILACRPLPCEHAMGPGFVLSEKDEQDLEQLMGAPALDPALNGLQALGWYHSHLRSKIFLSERDRQVHSRYFTAPYQVALVVRSRSGGPARAGFFFEEPSGEMRTDSSYEEFSMEPPAPAPRPVIVPQQVRAHARTLPAEPERSRTEAICPKCGSRQLRRSRRSGPIERLRGVLGSYPYRCQECLSRSFLKTSSDLLECARSSRRKRPEERKRAWQRTRREFLLWGGGVSGFLAILYYLIRDTGPKQDQP